ncbi:MAG: membrane dipeptidase, partial [Anaerolineae bacterium]|nr:membrane dipeptidase [Anaerolineae bacterium]
PQLPLSRVVDVIDYICQLTGSAKFAALGSDLDGGFGKEHLPTGLDTAADLYKLGSELRVRGFTDEHIEAILFGNWIRIIRQVLENSS